MTVLCTRRANGSNDANPVRRRNRNQRRSRHRLYCSLKTTSRSAGGAPQLQRVQEQTSAVRVNWHATRGR